MLATRPDRTGSAPRRTQLGLWLSRLWLRLPTVRAMQLSRLPGGGRDRLLARAVEPCRSPRSEIRFSHCGLRRSRARSACPESSKFFEFSSRTPRLRYRSPASPAAAHSRGAACSRNTADHVDELPPLHCDIPRALYRPLNLAHSRSKKSSSRRSMPAGSNPERLKLICRPAD